MAETFNFCGVAVYLAPDAGQDRVDSILSLPGVELEAMSGACRLAVTIVDTPQAMAIDQIAAIHRMPGVVAASLIYHAMDTPDEAGCREENAQPCPDVTCQHRGAGAPLPQFEIR